MIRVVLGEEVAEEVEYSKERGFYYEENETRIWWLFTFEILENLVKKYSNPLNPDSARVVYELQPFAYADPDSSPNPIGFGVEIRDKDSVLVYGPRNLTTDEQRTRVLYWDGRDNAGDTVSFESGPFRAWLKLQYRAGRQQPGWTLSYTDLSALSLTIDTIICPNDDTSFTYAPEDFPDERIIRCQAEIDPESFHEMLKDEITWRVVDNPNDEIISLEGTILPNPGEDVQWQVSAPAAPNGRIPTSKGGRVWTLDNF